MKDHEISQLVNALRDTALAFHDHQSLRDRIARIVLPVLKDANPPEGAHAVYSQGWADRAAMELDAHRDPAGLALRLGVCMGALHELHKQDAAAGLDLYKQLLGTIPPAVQRVLAERVADWAGDDRHQA